MDEAVELRDGKFQFNDNNGDRNYHTQLQTPIAFDYLTRRLEQVGISECGAEAEYVITLRVLRNGLHDGPVDDN